MSCGSRHRGIYILDFECGFHNNTIHMYSGITSGKVFDEELRNPTKLI